VVVGTGSKGFIYLILLRSLRGEFIVAGAFTQGSSDELEGLGFVIHRKYLGGLLTEERLVNRHLVLNQEFTEIRLLDTVVTAGDSVGLQLAFSDPFQDGDVADVAIGSYLTCGEMLLSSSYRVLSL
jgi:hypothetical protein